MTTSTDAAGTATTSPRALTWTRRRRAAAGFWHRYRAHRSGLAGLAVLVLIALLALSAPLLGERVRGPQWIAIAAGFAGVLLIVRPAGGGFEWVLLLPVCAALTNGLRDTYTRRLSRTESSLSMLFWSGVLVMIAGLCTIPYGWNSVGIRDAGWFLLAGFFNAAAHFMVIEAFRMGKAALVAPFRYTGLLWATLWGYLVWREVPGPWTFAGAAVVVCAGVYMLRQGVRKP